MKHVIYCLVSFVILSSTPVNTLAQNAQDSQISIDATGEIFVPADKIHFRVNINQFNQNAREAFNLHKEQEVYLTELLLEEEIPESNITANPISISHVRRYSNTEQNGYETQQEVFIVIDDISQFESMQIRLIENGFTNFSGSFTAENLEMAADQALQKAVKEARRKAELLAEAAGKQILDVLAIQTQTARSYSARGGSMEMASYDLSNGSLLQFERTIPVRVTVSVKLLID